MKNLNIIYSEITWERTKSRFNSEVKYKSKILNHGDHISVSKDMYLDGVLKTSDSVHIPIEVIKLIKQGDRL